MGKLTYTDNRENKQIVEYTKTKRGQFSRVYFAGEWVYIVCADDCADKEILCLIGDARHIPYCERVGSVGENDVYKMPCYKPLTKADAQAWKDFLFLQRLFKHALRVSVYHSYDGFKRAAHMIEEMEKIGCDSSICDAFMLLDSWASSYGAQYCVEICKRNMAVDSKGDLILLDCYFDLDKLRKK